MKSLFCSAAATVGLWLCANAVVALAAEANADDQGDDQSLSTSPSIAVALYRGQGLDTNLRMIPGQMFSGTLPWENTWYAAIVLGGSIVSWGPFVLGAESSLLKHWGLQDNFESTFAGTIAYGGDFFSYLSVGFLFGEGLSYAYSPPTFEKGPNDTKTEQVRLQNHLVFELELSSPVLRHLSIVGRIHHRSGVYGVFGPPRIGSNFMAMGLKFQF